jgi:hypothetical protein
MLGKQITFGSVLEKKKPQFEDSTSLYMRKKKILISRKNPVQSGFFWVSLSLSEATTIMQAKRQRLEMQETG